MEGRRKRKRLPIKEIIRDYRITRDKDANQFLFQSDYEEYYDEERWH